MRKLIIIITIILFNATSVFALPPAMLGSMLKPGATCPSGTYLFAWDGDYSGDTDKACFTNGTVQKDGTVTGATIGTDYGQTGYGMMIDAANEYITWANGSNEGMDDAEGTVYMSVKPFSVWDNTITLFNYNLDAANKLKLYLLAADGTYIEHVTSFYGSAGTVTLDTWNRIGFAWTASGDILAVKIGAGAWTTKATTVNDITNMTDLIFGNYSANIETIYIDRIVVLGTYQADDPGF